MFHAFEKVQMDLVRQSLQDGPLGKLLGKSSAKTAVFNNKLLKFGKAYQQFIPLGEFLPLQTPMSLLSSPHSSRHFQASLQYQEDIPLQVCGCTAVCILQHPDYDQRLGSQLGGFQGCVAGARCAKKSDGPCDEGTFYPLIASV